MNERLLLTLRNKICTQAPVLLYNNDDGMNQQHLIGRSREEKGIDVAIGRSKACHIQSKFRWRLIGRRRSNVRHVKKNERRKLNMILFSKPENDWFDGNVKNHFHHSIWLSIKFIHQFMSEFWHLDVIKDGLLHIRKAFLIIFVIGAFSRYRSLSSCLDKDEESHFLMFISFFFFFVSFSKSNDDSNK